MSIRVNACLACSTIFQRLRLGDFHEQCVCVKLCFILGKTFSETFRMLKQAFGDEAMSRKLWCRNKSPSLHNESKTSPIPKKALQVWSNVEVMLTVFCDCEGLIHHECLPCGQTENKDYYPKVTKRLRGAVRTKRTDLWRGGKMAAASLPRFSAFVPSDSLFSHKTWDNIHPPASVLIRPCTNQHLSFHQAEIFAEGMTIWACWGDNKNSLAELHRIPKEAYQECFQNWKRCWEHFIKSGGEYLKGDRDQ